MRPTTVVLIADPPAGPKIHNHLAELDGVAVHYLERGGTRIGPTCEVLRRGNPSCWALVMNGHGHGEALKDACRKGGTHYLSIPATWGAIRRVMEEAGFPFGGSSLAPARPPAPPPEQIWEGRMPAEPVSELPAAATMREQGLAKLEAEQRAACEGGWPVTAEQDQALRELTSPPPAAPTDLDELFRKLPGFLRLMEFARRARRPRMSRADRATQALAAYRILFDDETVTLKYVQAQLTRQFGRPVLSTEHLMWLRDDVISDARRARIRHHGPLPGTPRRAARPLVLMTQRERRLSLALAVALIVASLLAAYLRWA